MRFALFYEIPVAQPWEPDSERLAYEHTLEQAVAGDRFGWDAFWTVEHHFLSEFSHCSNPCENGPQLRLPSHPLFY